MATRGSVGIQVLPNIVLIFIFSLFTINAYADEHAYKANAKHELQPLKHGEKWQTDDALRKGMENIRNVVLVVQNDVLKGSLSASEYVRIGLEVEKNIASITKNCKLSVESDKAFHTVVLADMAEGAGLMLSSKNIQMQRLSALAVLQTLRNYGKYFEHPNWNLDSTKVN